MGEQGDMPARRRVGLVALLVVLTLGVMARALTLDWTGFDDTAYVTRSALMTAPDGLRRIWTTGESEQYYPLTFTLYRVLYGWFGAKAAGYHAVQVLMHAANAALLLVLLRRLGLGGWTGFFAAALFAVHPTQVMSVAWIAELKNTLAVLFMLASMLAWVRSARAERGTWWYVLSLGLFVLAMLSKTAVVGLPISLLLLDGLVLGLGWGRGARRAGGMLLIGAGLAALTMVFERKFIDPTARDWVPELPERLQIAGAAPWAYVARLAWPVSLSPAYELWPVGRGSVAWWMPLGATVVTGCGLLWAGLRKRLSGVVVWGCAHFVLLLGPTLGVIAFGNLAVTYTSDHFLYPASWGVFAALAWALAAVGKQGRAWSPAITGAGVVGLSVCGVVTIRDTAVWRNARTLWTRGVEVAPRNYTANLGLAEGLMEEGRPREAMVHYSRALEVRPDWVDGYMLLGDAQRDSGDLPAAEATYRRALAMAPENVPVMAGLAGVLERRRALDEALRMYERAVEVDGRHTPSRMGLAKMYMGYNRHADALAQFQAVVADRRDQPLAYLGIATCLSALGRRGEAAGACDDGLRVAPDHVPLLNMAAQLRLDSDPGRALILARRANELAGGQYQVMVTLAQALAATGHVPEARRVALEAAARAEAAGDARTASMVREAVREWNGGP